MFYSVDRIENGVAVLIDDDGNRFDIAAEKLPEKTGESDILFFDGEDYIISDDERKRRSNNIRSKLNKLNIKNKK